MRSSAQIDLDDPDQWREFARIAITCPFWTAESYAVRLGIDPRRAAAMVKTYYHPPDDGGEYEAG